ncbi:MAG TPA: PA2169 family four-helix-bundle protein [Candidatus Binataceae bacterium]|nr:PA2169 family four-helix-bundle protein [Candidatus Binataceae bacterium]
MNLEKNPNANNLEEILDRLISVCVDSEHRYRHAYLDVSRERVSRFFEAKAEERKRMADELEAMREQLGVHKREHGTLGGVLKRIEMEINVQMSMGDTGVVDWCRKEAEDVIEEYENALRQNLPPLLDDVVKRQLAEIRRTVRSMDEELARYGGPRS